MDALVSIFSNISLGDLINVGKSLFEKPDTITTLLNTFKEIASIADSFSSFLPFLALLFGL